MSAISMGAIDATFRMLILRVVEQNRVVPSAHGGRTMPRHPRLFHLGATYHVYCRVARSEFIFDDSDLVQELTIQLF